jgi:hypothetical protein
MSAFGPVVVLSLVAVACTLGFPAFVRAHSRTRCRLGLRGQFTRGVQHFTQPDGYGAARLRRRLVLRWEK